MSVKVKRAYARPSRSDGARVLVDRLWPRGVKKQEARIGHWLKDLAPSDGLRKWFHSSENWQMFKKRYLKELSTPAAMEELMKLYQLTEDHEEVTLVYSSRDVEHNNAVVLKELLEGSKKPPTSSGPVRATAAAGRAAKRRSS